MTALTDWFELDEGTRLTGIWRFRNQVDDDDPAVHLAFISLGSGQDANVEGDFLSSHLPWVFGGLELVDPSGDPMLVVVQVAPRSVAKLDGSDDPWQAMHRALAKALALNPWAGVREVHELEVADLAFSYMDLGVTEHDLDGWTVADLLAGLMATTVGVPVSQLLAGRVVNCAFSGLPHDCRDDVFDDVFSAWVRGELSRPEPTIDVQWDIDRDDATSRPPAPEMAASERRLVTKKAVPAPRRRRWTKKKVKRWSTQRLRLHAVESGWSAKKATRASRKELIRRLVDLSTT